MQEMFPLVIDELRDSNEEDLPIRKEDWTEIDKRIAGAIDALRPHGWKRAIFWLREMGPISGTLALITALLGIAGAGWNYAFTRIEKQAAFQTTTERRLSDIEKELKDIHGDLAKQSIISHSSLPLKDFQATLPEFHAAVRTAKEQRVDVSPMVVNDIQQKLAASADVPTFWPTVADFITYRSQVALQNFTELLRPDLPICTDNPPIPMELILGEKDEIDWKGGEGRTLSMDENVNGTKFVGALYKDCRFILDSSDEAAKIPNVDRSFALIFRHCQIVYRGGPISMLTGPNHPVTVTGKGPHRSDLFILRGKTVRFESCLLLFVINTKPPAEGQTMTHQLLTQSGPNFTVKSRA